MSGKPPFKHVGTCTHATADSSAAVSLLPESCAADTSWRFARKCDVLAAICAMGEEVEHVAPVQPASHRQLATAQNRAPPGQPTRP